MDREIDSVLEQSISSIADGKARVESCLLSYPTMADELEPLLRTAEQLRAVPKADLAPEAKARIADRVLTAATADARLRPASRRSRAVAVLPWWRWAFGALAAAFVFVLVAMATLVTASADALPGSGLYPVKLAAEDVWLWATPEHARPALHLHLAHRRLAEVRALAEEGRFDESVVQAMTAHVEAALEGVEGLPPAVALPVLEQMAAQMDEQQQTLAELRTQIPAASRQYLEEALRAGERLRALVAALQDRLNLSEPSPSPMLADTAAPDTTPALTGTWPITITVAPTPTVTATPSAISTAPPTSQPASGTTPEETQLPPPTATQPPPPTATQPPPPTLTPAPAGPTDTPRVPPGLTKTPEPPGQTRTPRP